LDNNKKPQQQKTSHPFLDIERSTKKQLASRKKQVTKQDLEQIKKQEVEEMARTIVNPVTGLKCG
jgi:hypothetical protein